MKISITVGLLVSIANVNAAVYKCESGTGIVEYQDSPCVNAVQTKKIAVVPIDPKIIEQAQKKLAKELQEREKLEQERAEEEKIERALRATEMKARAEQDLVYETQKQTDAIYENTQAVRKNTRRQYGNWVIYK